MFGFPRLVDEVSVRIVAGVVAVVALLALVARAELLVVLLAAGFILRVLAGPRLSPLALVVTRVVRPRLAMRERPVPGPPKRFAQGIGAMLTTVAAVVLVAADAGAGWWLVGAVVVAATLESVLGLCLGCQVFALLMRAGVIPDAICEECANLAMRRTAS